MKRILAIVIASAALVDCDCIRNPALVCGHDNRDACPSGTRARLSSDPERSPACVAALQAR